MWGINRRKKLRKKRFLYSHEYRDEKIGGKNARNNFSRNSPNSASKNVGEKIVAKNCEKNVFYIHKYIVTKKWWKKTSETIFPETHQTVRAKMLGKKSSQKIAKKIFLYSHD